MTANVVTVNVKFEIAVGRLYEYAPRSRHSPISTKSNSQVSNNRLRHLVPWAVTYPRSIPHSTGRGSELAARSCGVRNVGSLICKLNPYLNINSASSTLGHTVSSRLKQLGVSAWPRTSALATCTAQRPVRSSLREPKAKKVSKSHANFCEGKLKCPSKSC
ncbi:hypothetical protein JB92DRAFT_2163380 [Gautieria morchelliformis]|nr:hypothetical protein JB92DRAFT_2163380 [Gautieria morchelliformis]